MIQAGYMCWIEDPKLCNKFVAGKVMETLFEGLNESKNCSIWGVALLPSPKPPSCFLEHAKTSLHLDSSQYTIILSESLIRLFLLQGKALTRSSHLDLNCKRFLNDWLGPKYMY